MCSTNEKTEKSKAKPFDINGDGTVDFRDFKALFTGDRFVEQDPESALRNRIDELWAEHEHRFVVLSVAIQKREREARHWIRSRLPFGQDRKVIKILESLSRQFEDRDLLVLRTEYIACTDSVKRCEKQLADVKASISMQSGGSNDRYEKAASKIESKIVKERGEKQRILHSYKNRMEMYGVDLSNPQAEVLLSRIDAGDVTRMSTIFVVISGITNQFADAKRDSGENIDVAKKYYGIYIGLLELQIRIQSEYIESIDTRYLPGVSKIGDEASQLVAETTAIMKTASKEHMGQYQQNINAQEFTIKVTSIYEDALRADRTQVVQARALVEELHKLAENTLSTVRVSADLSALVRQAEGLYKEVMSLQTPALVPFENIQFQREFEAVTVRLRGSF